jgi:hypothetical protein
MSFDDLGNRFPYSGVLMSLAISKKRCPNFSISSLFFALAKASCSKFSPEGNFSHHSAIKSASCCGECRSKNSLP